VSSSAGLTGRGVGNLALHRVLTPVLTSRLATRAALPRGPCSPVDPPLERLCLRILSDRAARLRRRWTIRQSHRPHNSHHRIITALGHNDECSSHRSTFDGLLLTTPQRGMGYQGTVECATGQHSFVISISAISSGSRKLLFAPVGQMTVRRPPLLGTGDRTRSPCRAATLRAGVVLLASG
jgi:hypothetical protein